MSLTINTKTYERDNAPTPNSVRYVGPANTFAFEDACLLKRIPPKPTADSAGIAKCQLKLVSSCTDGTDDLADKVYASADFSMPAAISLTELQARVDDFQSAIGAALFDALVEKLDIDQ